MFKKVILWTIAAIVPLIFSLIAGEIFDELISNPGLYPIFILFISIYYLYIWLFIFYGFVDYYLDVWIVTTERIVNIEQKGLFARVVSEQRLDRIQDVTSELKGFFSTMLNYGNVYIQTAGEQTRFIFKEVAQPQKVAKKINQIVEKNKKYHKIIDGKDSINTK